VTYESFVDTELPVMEEKGVIKRWTVTQPPTCVLPLRVVDDHLPKLRLCANPMYPNLFMEYERFQYERLTDLPNLFAKDDYMYTTDDKSGYWHVPLHPSF
jgi:hypothetical protein